MYILSWTSTLGLLKDVLDPKKSQKNLKRISKDSEAC